MASATVQQFPRVVQFPSRKSRRKNSRIPASFNQAIAQRWRMVDETRTGRRSGTVILQKGLTLIAATYTPSSGRVGINFAKPTLL